LRATRSFDSADATTCLRAVTARPSAAADFATAATPAPSRPPLDSHLSLITDILFAFFRPSARTQTSSAASGTRFTAIAPALVMFAARFSAPSAMPGRRRRLTSVFRELFHAATAAWRATWY